MKNYESLDDALSVPGKKGHKDDCVTDSFCLYCGDLDIMRLDPEDFHVDEIDRVESKSNPADSSMPFLHLAEQKAR